MGICPIIGAVNSFMTRRRILRSTTSQGPPIVGLGARASWHRRAEMACDPRGDNAKSCHSASSIPNRLPHHTGPIIQSAKPADARESSYGASALIRTAEATAKCFSKGHRRAATLRALATSRVA